jgi:hypothetical protein
MDRRRRRFVPSSEGLEGRQLLSTASASAALANPYITSSGAQLEGTAPTKQTIEAKRHMVENLPYFIGMLNKDGFVPQPTTQNIQTDVDSIVAELSQANSSLDSTFDLDLRRAQKYENITPQGAQALNRDLGAVLVSAGAPASTVADLQNQLNSLVQYDATQVGSTTAATNDFALVGQLAAIVGRPLVYPNVPSLTGADHNGNAGKIAITHNHQPSLTGTYIAGVDIQIVDHNNNVVLGQAAVGSNGSYTVRFNEPLPDGTYSVRTRVEDSGYLSAPSPQFTFKVVTPPPPKVKA